MSAPTPSKAVSVPTKTATLYDVSAARIDRDVHLTRTVKFDNPPAVAANKAAQLHALLHMTYGESAEAFANMANEIRDHLMWLASDLALEIRVLCELENGGAA